MKIHSRFVALLASLILTSCFYYPDGGIPLNRADNGMKYLHDTLAENKHRLTVCDTRSGIRKESKSHQSMKEFADSWAAEKFPNGYDIKIVVVDPLKQVSKHSLTFLITGS